MSRQGSFSRKTRETHIEMKLNLDGSGIYEINTGVGFFNHMLEALSRHSLIDMKLDASGDVHVDYHHLVEDTGIVFGQAVNKLLGDKAGIYRYGSAVVPLDEALVEAVIDCSGRPSCVTDLNRFHGQTGEFAFELGDVFFQGVASQGFTVHLTVRRGENLHHILEASFKAFAKALRAAVSPDPRQAGQVPSTKGVLA